MIGGYAASDPVSGILDVESRRDVSPGLIDRPAHILIVEDELHSRQLLESMLGREGFVLQTAAGGEEALALVAREPPDLILLDVLMEGMDGYQVAAAIKTNPATENIPIIMITALDDDKTRLLGLSAGAEDIQSKPVVRAELSARVRNLLRLKAHGDYHDRHTRMLEDEVDFRTAALVESERLYRSTFDAAPVGIVHVGLDGQWLRVNQRLCDLLGYSCGDLQSAAVQRLLQPDEAAGAAESFRRMVSGTLDPQAQEEQRFRRHDGSLMWARINMSVHRDGEGRPQHFIKVIEDITERRALEARVRQANKMDAIGRLASGVAHDFNNLLTVILGCTELISADDDIADRHGDDLTEISRAAQRAAGLTRQLLAFSRQQVLLAAPVDLNALIAEMTSMLGRLIGKHIEIELALAAHGPLAFADRGQLEQVVMNLVVNARDAMPGGGRMTIETADIELESSPLDEMVIVPGPYAMLAITDTGGGMSKETQRRLFEPFFTTKEAGKGTGLGLSTTYGIVKQSKGYIWAYSELGRGTTFKVYLPRSKSDVPVTARSLVAAAPVPRASETILFVEDEANVRRLSRRVLEKAGYRVLEAASGDDFERLSANHAGPIDLVVTDVIMPGRSGSELLQRLQVESPALRVLYMSGNTEESAVRQEGIDRGHLFVEKPFTAAELVRKVREALDR